MWSPTRTVDPSVDPVTLAEAKAHLRVDTTADDTLITAQIKAATGWVEEHTGRQLITATWKLTLDDWPWEPWIVLARPPVISITSLKFNRDDGTVGTVDPADYFLDNSDDYRRHRLVIATQGATWPSDLLRPAAAVEVLYQAGYGAAGSDVPATIVTAVKMVIGTLYEHREETITGTIAAQLGVAESLLQPYRVML